jgi:hypothetical protein
MRRGLNRRRMVSSWVAALLLLGSVGLIDARADVGAVTVSGDVRAPSAFTVDQLRALPAQTASVTFETKAGRESHTYTGATAEAVVQAAQPNVDTAAKHPELPIAILAVGADGYSAALAWGDVSSEMAKRPVLVAYAEDGATLAAPRLVVPDDLSGARYVSDLTELRVVNLSNGD